MPGRTMTADLLGRAPTLLRGVLGEGKAREATAAGGSALRSPRFPRALTVADQDQQGCSPREGWVRAKPARLLSLKRVGAWTWQRPERQRRERCARERTVWTTADVRR